MSGGTKFVDSNRNVYEPVNSGGDPGYYNRGKLFGQGRINFINGDLYEGAFKDGKRCGFGKMQYKSIKKYSTDDDDITDNSMENQDLDWASYEGHWKNNLRHGYGVMKWADDSEFKGEWLQDHRHHGTMNMVNGSTYTGFWKNDKFHGKGVLKTFDELVFEGEFINGYCEKYGKVIYPEGEVYTGELDDMQRQGYGKLEENGDVYEGYFEENKKNGKGKMYVFVVF